VVAFWPVETSRFVNVSTASGVSHSFFAMESAFLIVSAFVFGLAFTKA